MKDLYIMDVEELHKDLYRMGNGSWPAFTEKRSWVDFVIVKKRGVWVVLPNGNGFSAFDHLTSIMKRPAKKVWQLKAGTPLPDGVRCSGGPATRP
ncbi:MAG: hypothetical protein PF961_09675 [Planctomycetota bacterium]|nr:hypothetical protein [Planctomycetota bacterium]